MDVEPVAGRHSEWAVVIGRSFGISESVSDKEGRKIVIECIQGQLRESGWRGATRAIAEPMLDALIELGADGGLDAYLLRPETAVSPETAGTRDAAHRVLDRAIAVVDPEHLVVDVPGEYPSEILLVAQQSVDRVVVHLREQHRGN